MERQLGNIFKRMLNWESKFFSDFHVFVKFTAGLNSEKYVKCGITLTKDGYVTIHLSKHLTAQWNPCAHS